MKPDLGERRKEQIKARQAPDHLAGRAGSDAADEECRRRTVDRAVSAACHFVQRAMGEPTSRQLRIDSCTPNGRTLRLREPAPSRLAIFSRNSSTTAFEVATTAVMISFTATRFRLEMVNYVLYLFSKRK